MNEYIVLLSDGAEIIVTANSGDEAEQIARENHMQPVPTMAVRADLA